MCNLLLDKNLKLVLFINLASDYTVVGDNTIIACSYPNLTKSVKVGIQILIADGTLVCTVIIFNKGLRNFTKIYKSKS